MPRPEMGHTRCGRRQSLAPGPHAKRSGPLRRLVLVALSLSFLLAASWLPVLARPQVALAHAFAIGSDPAAGSTIASSPALVRIFFNAAVSSASIAHVYLFTSGSTPSQGQLVDAARSAVPPTNARELDTPLLLPARLPQGSYQVRWTALAAGDGHATSGLIGFNVGHAATGLSGAPLAGPGTGNDLPHMSLQGALAVLWEWLTQLVLTCWVGLLVAQALIRGPGVEQIRKHGGALHWLCLVALLVGETMNLALRATLLTQSSNGNGIDPAAVRQLVLETSYGHLWLVRLGLICMALGSVWWGTARPHRAGHSYAGRGASGFAALRKQLAQELEQKEEQGARTGEYAGDRAPTKTAAPADTTPARDGGAPPEPGAWSGSPPLRAIAWLALAGLVLLSRAFSGDVVQVAQQHISAVVLEWLFLAAEGVWFGGATYLGFVLMPPLPASGPGEQRGQTLAAVSRRYRPALLAAIGALLVSGLFLSEASVSSARQLLIDPFGRALLVQILLVALALIVSGYGLFVLLPKLGRPAVLPPDGNAALPTQHAGRTAPEQVISGPASALRLLSLLGAGVLLCAALMSFYAPPVASPALNDAGSVNSPSTGSQNTSVKRVGNLSVRVEVLPARLNTANTVIVSLIESDGTPVTDAQVQISADMAAMDMGAAREPARGQGGNSTYSAVFSKGEAFSMFGDWTIGVSIQRPRQPPVRVTFVVTLTG